MLRASHDKLMVNTTRGSSVCALWKAPIVLQALRMMEAYMSCGFQSLKAVPCLGITNCTSLESTVWSVLGSTLRLCHITVQVSFTLWALFNLLTPEIKTITRTSSMPRRILTSLSWICEQCARYRRWRIPGITDPLHPCALTENERG